MKRYLKHTLATLAFATLTWSAFAQEGPPPRDENGVGGPPMDMQQAPRPPRGPENGGGPMLLLSPQVQKELRLTATQVNRLREAVRPRISMGGQQGNGDRGGPGPRDEKARSQADAKVKAILSVSQFSRWQEIQLQVQGPMALGRTDVARKVGLTSSQIAWIHKILEQNRPPQRGGPGGPGQGFGQGGPGGPPPMDGPRIEGEGQRPPLDGPMRGGPGMRGPNDAMRAKVEKKVLSVLNDGQLAKWKKLLGAPFKLERPNRPPRGGQG